MSDNIPYVVKQVLKLYDISHLTYINKKPNKLINGYFSITVHIVFTPKEETIVSPKKAASYGVVNYYRNNRRIEELMHVGDRDIPILSYVNDIDSFHKFLEDYILKVADEAYNKMKGKQHYG
jgi:hypothetical protein